VGKGKDLAAQNRLLVGMLRELRLDNGLTQAELASRLGKPQSFVSKVERAERIIDAVELRRWCIALDVDVVRVIRDWSKRLQELKPILQSIRTRQWRCSRHTLGEIRTGHPVNVTS
jgi:transcriptional regulator with XRE-family HTH domain